MGLLGKAVVGFAQQAVAIAVCLFLPAWTWHFWQAWTLLGIFTVCWAGTLGQLYRHDPELLERRLRSGPSAEQTGTQRIIQVLISLCFVACLAVPAFDHRLGWSSLPPLVCVGGNGLLALGIWLIYRVFQENSFASATIEVGDAQRVIATGLYAHVRHPMYAAGLVVFVAIPLALGSAVGLLTVVPMLGVLAWRLLDEERFLRANLDGYEAYTQQTRYRLVPGVW